jgi:hypothetical protein
MAWIEITREQYEQGGSVTQAYDGYGMGGPRCREHGAPVIRPVMTAGAYEMESAFIGPQFIRCPNKSSRDRLTPSPN